MTSSIDPFSIDLGIHELLEEIHAKYGYDFQNYSEAHIRRRVLTKLESDNLENIDALIEKVLSDTIYAQNFLDHLSIRVTEMFRDPPFYQVIREKVIPLLKTWSFIRIWHAGCSTGEEVYSMAILLKEEGLYDRVQLYATDYNQSALNHAKAGIYEVQRIKKYIPNYQNSKPKASLSDYYFAQYDAAIMDFELKKNIVWANHNLVTDNDFAEMHMIICRNVLIYFNRNLQNRVFELFHKSLVNGGFLCLGTKENIKFSSQESNFEVVDPKQKVFKKKYAHE